MKATIVTIGDEILIGQIIDTNSAFISKELNKINVSVNEILSISDTPQHLIKTIDKTLESSDIVIMTGGLGPTKDDKTKQTLCDYFNTKLILHNPTLSFITEIFEKRGLEVSETNRSQALVPEYCDVIFNQTGTAPCMWFNHKNKIVISMPGVPHETKWLMDNEIIPRLTNLSGQNIFHKTLFTIGIPESHLSERISNWENSLPSNINLAYLPSPGAVKLRLSAYGKSDTDIKTQVESEIIALKEILKNELYDFESDSIHEEIINILLRNSEKLSVAESCTGGSISQLITSVSGCSSVYNGGICVYSNEAKSSILGVDKNDIENYGAVSQEVVEQMALQAMVKFRSDYSIATSGIAGPSGGTKEKPVGTVWIAVGNKGKVLSHKFIFGGMRDIVIKRAVINGFKMLYDIMAS